MPERKASGVGVPRDVLVSKKKERVPGNGGETTAPCGPFKRTRRVAIVR